MSVICYRAPSGILRSDGLFVVYPIVRPSHAAQIAVSVFVRWKVQAPCQYLSIASSHREEEMVRSLSFSSLSSTSWDDPRSCCRDVVETQYVGPTTLKVGYILTIVVDREMFDGCWKDVCELQNFSGRSDGFSFAKCEISPGSLGSGSIGQLKPSFSSREGFWHCIMGIIARWK